MGSRRFVSALLDEEPLRPNALSRSGWHPAHLALKAGHLDTLRVLIASRLIDLTVPSSNGRTLFDMLEAITVEDPHYEEIIARLIETPEDQEENETLDDHDRSITTPASVSIAYTGTTGMRNRASTSAFSLA